jgi:hypothetical protein
MTDRFLRDILGEPCRLTDTRTIDWSAGAVALLEAALVNLSGPRRIAATRRLREGCERAARTQQYPTITATTVRAQIAGHAWIISEGENDR